VTDLLKTGNKTITNTVVEAQSTMVANSSVVKNTLNAPFTTAEGSKDLNRDASATVPRTDSST
jgi:hypothetical protein